MMIKTKSLFATALIALLACPFQGAAAEDNSPLKDPSFELKLSPDQGGWTPFKVSWFSTDQARTGVQSMFNGGYSRRVPHPPYFVGSVSGSFQEFPAAPGTRWRLTGYALAPTKILGEPAFGIVQVSFFNAKGKDLGTVETVNASAPAKTSNEINSRTPAAEWTLLDTGIATAPEGTATIQAFTLYVDFSGSDTSQGVYFDDLNLCALADDDDAACKSLDGDM